MHAHHAIHAFHRATGTHHAAPPPADGGVARLVTPPLPTASPRHPPLQHPPRRGAPPRPPCCLPPTPPHRQRLPTLRARLGGRQIPLQLVDKGQRAFVQQHPPYLGPPRPTQFGCRCPPLRFRPRPLIHQA